MGWDTHFSNIQKPPEEPYMTSASSAQSGYNSSLNSSNQVQQCLLPRLYIYYTDAFTSALQLSPKLIGPYINNNYLLYLD